MDRRGHAGLCRPPSGLRVTPRRNRRALAPGCPGRAPAPADTGSRSGLSPAGTPVPGGPTKSGRQVRWYSWQVVRPGPEEAPRQVAGPHGWRSPLPTKGVLRARRRGAALGEVRVLQPVVPHEAVYVACPLWPSSPGGRVRARPLPMPASRRGTRWAGRPPLAGPRRGRPPVDAGVHPGLATTRRKGVRHGRRACPCLTPPRPLASRRVPCPSRRRAASG